MRFFYLSILLLLSFSSFSQKKGKKEKTIFDIIDFNKKAALAEWFHKYALFSNYANKEIGKQNKEDIKRIGAASFCFEENGIWHAVYGNYRNGEYETVFHFVNTEEGQVSKTTDPIDSSFLATHATALATANKHLPVLKPKREVRFEQFIKQNEDRTFTVCFLPAFQTDEVAIYGEEFLYTIDSTGTTVLQDDSYQKKKYKGFKVDVPRRITLDYEDVEKPSIGAIYFVWLYKDFFKQITIDNKGSMSYLAKTNRGWSWQHGLKAD